ncbi:hypothetical protein H6761_01855 [Candidatus Nomurabacteria bacterium]|nr:hypothetical protein [Candidatus Nomurabacteria bacterium]
MEENQNNLDQSPDNQVAQTPTENLDQNPQPEEKKKKKFFFWFLFALGVYALIQSIIVFGRDEAPEISDNNQEVASEQLLVEEVADESSTSTDDFVGGIGGQRPNFVAPPKVPVAPAEDLSTSTEDLLTDLTLDDCIEADIVMAALNPEDINDDVVNQCLLMWEDLQDLLQDEEATSTPTSTRPIYGGGGNGGGGGSEIVLSDNANLNIFKVDFVDVLPFANLTVKDFTETGANLLIDDYFCSETEVSSQTCLDPNKNFLGLFLEPEDQNISYIKVEIVRPSAILVYPAPTFIWENEKILSLHKENILPGDVIQVTVVAEDGTTQAFYKLNIIGNQVNDASLQKFSIGQNDILKLDNVKVAKMEDEGASLFVPVISEENCHEWSDHACVDSIDLNSLFVEANDPDASYLGVSLLRDKKWQLWENKDIDELSKKEFTLNDVIVVRVVSENGLTETLYKVTILPKVPVTELSKEDVEVLIVGKEEITKKEQIIKPIRSGGGTARISPIQIKEEIKPVEIEVIEFQDSEELVEIEEKPQMIEQDAQKSVEEIKPENIPVLENR